MTIPLYRNMRIRTKLISLTIFLVLLPLLCVALLSIIRFSQALRKASEEDLEHLVSNIYSTCRVQEEMVQKKVVSNLNVAREIFYRHGLEIKIITEKMIHFDAVNQFTGEIIPVEVPSWKIDETPITWDNRIVDEVRELVGGTCTIFQKITGDHFLRISTNVVRKNGKRAIGSFIPSDSPVARALLKGRSYKGRAYVVDDWYIAAYEPIMGKDGTILGALYVGVREQSSQSLKDEIKGIKVGETGYVYITDSRGNLKIHPAKEGLNIMDSKDPSGFEYIRAMIDDVLRLPPGEVGTIRYPWINPELGETKPRQKILKYIYFEPWDWIITAGTYEEEIYQALYSTVRFIIIIVLISVIMALVLTFTLSKVLTKPIQELTEVTTKMLEGDLSQRVKILGADEIGILGTSFNRMVAQIQDYTSNLEKMVEDRTVELKESREKYRDLSRFLNSILDSATEYAIMALDVYGNIIEFNKGSEKIFGWKKEEVVRKRHISITDTPEDRNEKIQKEIVNRTRDEGVFEQDMYRIRKDGSRFPSYTNITAIRGPSNEVAGFVEIVRDITRRKSLERELRETRDFLENIMESSVDGIVTTDLKGKITYLNRAMEDMIQYRREDIMGTHISRFYLKGIQEARDIMDLLRKAERAESYEMEFKEKNGKIVPIVTSLFLLRDEDNQVIGTAGIFKDISGQKLLEAKLKAAQARLVEASKMRALGELVAGVAHEINNPLMASQTILHVILKHFSQDTPERERLELIRKCNDRIEKIVEHLREFSRQTKSEYLKLDINDPIENALLMTGQQLLDHDILIVKRLSEDLPKVLGDANQLEQVFLNLIANAKDAMKDVEGEKRLTIISSFIEEEEVPSVLISFKDTGIGIPEENMDKVLEPFFSTKPVGKGTGLGLSICFGIIESHGGRIEIKSEVDKGTEINIFIPLK
ncbi:Cache 3/Cache 2 fusion domain-containing protein [Thermodesulfobacteriota bacterium]